MKLYTSQKKFNFRQLDAETRRIMLDEVQLDEKKNHLYKSSLLTSIGHQKFPNLLKTAILNGDEQILSNNLKPYFKSLNEKGHKVPLNAASVLGQGQFNKYYCRAICIRAIQNQIEYVKTYRARYSQVKRATTRENRSIPAKNLLDDLKISDFGSMKYHIALPNSGMSIYF